MRTLQILLVLLVASPLNLWPPTPKWPPRGHPDRSRVYAFGADWTLALSMMVLPYAPWSHGRGLRRPALVDLLPARRRAG